jgi:hypothetical protein
MPGDSTPKYLPIPPHALPTKIMEVEYEIPRMLAG